MNETIRQPSEQIRDEVATAAYRVRADMQHPELFDDFLRKMQDALEQITIQKTRDDDPDWEIDPDDNEDD